MENILKNVKNVEKYSTISQQMVNKYLDMPANINATTALVMKNLRPLEVQYFKTTRQHGVACTFFERLLTLPPSKAWAVISEDIVGSLHYWLQAVKKFLQTDKDLWWIFLKQILKFIQELHLKDPRIPDMLVEYTSGFLFELATTECLDPLQHHEILYCLNVYCSQSCRKIRFIMRKEFSEYFVQLARMVCRGGVAALSCCALEALVRWLVPRERPQRAAAAQRWFPPALCPPPAHDFFRDSTWDRFHSDARKFLNMVNDATGLITSVRCRRVSVGGLILVSGLEKQPTWLDINTAVPSLSVMIDPRVLSREHRFRATEAVVLLEENTRSLRLHSQNMELMLTISTAAAPRVVPCGLSVGARGDVTVVLSSGADVRRLHAALTHMFPARYQSQIDLDAGLTLLTSQENTKTLSSSEESRFSHPEVVRRPRYSGVGIARRLKLQSGSPSSGGSITPRFRDKILQQWKHSYKPVDQYRTSVEKPLLSSISERTESDDYHSIHSRTTQILTFNPQFTCVCKNKKAESDSELKSKTHKCVADDDLSSKSLLHAVGDDALVYETLEKIYNSKNITDLYQDPTTNDSEVIENTPANEISFVSRKIGISVRRKCTVVSKSTTDDESNTEADTETPTYVNLRKNKRRRFLGRNSNVKVNFNVEEVVECLNAMVDKVCDDLFQYLRNIHGGSSPTGPDNRENENVTLNEKNKTNKTTNKNVAKKTNPIRKNNKPNEKNKPTSTKTKLQSKKTKQKSKKEINTVVEEQNEILERDLTDNNVQQIKNSHKKIKTPIGGNSSAKKKRKLYSPNDDEMSKKNIESASDSDEIVLAKLKSNQPSNITNSTATCYKYIENERKRIRESSSRKSRTPFIQSPSPSTKQSNDIFDRLKSTVENEEKFTFIDAKNADDVYNFTSGSEDIDFERKKKQLKKRVTSKRATRSASSNAKSRRKKSEKPSNDEAKKRKRTTAKKTDKTHKTDININQPMELIDERMRCADPNAVLDISLEHEKHDAEEPKRDADLILRSAEMEHISEESTPKNTNEKNVLNEASKSSSVKKRCCTKSDNNSTTSGSLPGLVIESVTAQVHNTDFNVSLIKRRVQEMYERDDSNISINKSDISVNKEQQDALATDTYDITSERSVSSVGIQAHRYSDEAPPSTEMLDKNISPRETVDMNDSVKKLYMALQEVCNSTPQRSEINQKESSKSSPLVLPFARRDYVRIPSKRSSESNTPSEHEPLKRKKVAKKREDLQLQQNTSPQTVNSSLKYPKVLLKRFQPTEIETITVTSLVEAKETAAKELETNKSKLNPKISNLGMKHRKIITISDDEQEKVDGCTSNRSDLSRNEPQSTPRYIRDCSSGKNVTNKSSEKKCTQRRSTISPIDMDALLPTNAVAGIEIDRTKERVHQPRISKIVASPEVPFESSRKNPSLRISSQERSSLSEKSAVESRNSNKPERQVESKGASTITWLKKLDIERTDIRTVTIDILKDVMEKLDTSFEECNQVTRNKFLEFFLDVQSQLSEHKKDMESIYKTAMERSEKRTAQFIEELKSKVHGVIKKDSQQKQLMVTILKDDINAVMLHIERTKKNNK